MLDCSLVRDGIYIINPFPQSIFINQHYPKPQYHLFFVDHYIVPTQVITMKLTTTIASFLAGLSVVLAIPVLEQRQLPLEVCTGATSNPQCCATDVLNLADLDCANRMSISFQETYEIKQFINPCNSTYQAHERHPICSCML